MIGLRRNVVHLAEYQSSWGEMFIAECSLLRKEIGDVVLYIEHVGSTSVPELPAKPILDIAVAVRCKDMIPALRRHLASLGYIDRGDNGENGGYLFVKESAPDVRTIHLHIVEETDQQWYSYIAIRDVLRSNPGVRRKYAELKRQLAKEYPNDRVSYTEGKSAFIKAILEDHNIGKDAGNVEVN